MQDQRKKDDVLLAGGGYTLAYDAGYPGSDWTSYAIPLLETAGWKNKSNSLAATQAQMQAVLANLQSIKIRGEYEYGADTGGIDSVYLKSAPVTPTPTQTFTPTATATNTSTPTATATNTSTPTPTPTNTPEPNYGGSGTCWSSMSSWASYTVSYSIDRNTIPVSMGWDSSISAAAQTWNDVTPSNFMFVNSAEGGNVIYFETPPNEEYLAQVSPHHISPFYYITEKTLRINPNYSWDTNNTPDPTDPDFNGSTTTYNVQNVITHEFGHWLQLEDFYYTCPDITMYHYVEPGELSKITLDAADENAINSLYP